MVFKLSSCLNICGFPGFLGLIKISMLACKMSLLQPPRESYTADKRLSPYHTVRSHTHQNTAVLHLILETGEVGPEYN